jgi:hypothetical protein
MGEIRSGTTKLINVTMVWFCIAKVQFWNHLHGNNFSKLFSPLVIYRGIAWDVSSIELSIANPFSDKVLHHHLLMPY